MLVDSHCHLDFLKFTIYHKTVAELIADAKAMDVKYFLNACARLEELPNILQIAENHTEVFASIGLHPGEHVDKEPAVEEFVNLAKHSKIIAIGETGLDYHYQDSDPELQKRRFINHIHAALETKKPLIIHARDAHKDILDILIAESTNQVGGVMHCFTEGWDVAKKVLDFGFYISFSGIVTFKNANLIQEAAKKIPLDRMLVETDSPYLAPEPMRGKPNQPAFTRYVAEYIANLRNISYEELATVTTENFTKLFDVAII